MKKSKFTEEQIALALKQAETGTMVEESCRKVDISQATFQACVSAVLPSEPQPAAQTSAQTQSRSTSHGAHATERPNQVWSMDFVAAALFDGRRFRPLTIFCEGPTRGVGQ